MLFVANWKAIKASQGKAAAPAPSAVVFTPEEEAYLAGQGDFIKEFYRKCCQGSMRVLHHFKRWTTKNFMQKRPVADIWELRAFNGKDNLEFINWYWKKVGGV